MRPPNYGVLSGLFAFLMQSVMFTPPMVNTFVRESLAALEYKRHCDSDGMFFLHTFDITKNPCLIGILQEDDSSVKRYLGGGLKVPGVSLIRGPQAALAESDDEQGRVEYPLGRTPTWAQIKQSLQADPFELVPRWRFPLELKTYEEAARSSVKGKACKIFIKLCRAIWFILHPGWLKPEGDAVEPTTINGALECLTVDFIADRMVNVQFRPCNAGLRGVSGRPMLSFGERLRIYFPDEGAALTKRWDVFAEEGGYLHLYHQEARRLNVNNTLELNRCLAELLSHCQCLPDSDLPEVGDAIWRVEKQRIILLANPKHLLMDGVGSGGGRGRKRAPRAPAAHRAVRDAKIQLLMQEGISAAVSAKAVRLKEASIRAEKKRRLDRRSRKKKNSRRPPKAKRRKASSEEGEAEEAEWVDEEEAEKEREEEEEEVEDEDKEEKDEDKEEEEEEEEEEEDKDKEEEEEEEDKDKEEEEEEEDKDEEEEEEEGEEEEDA